MKILWFRRDLRVNDNPILSIHSEVLPIFIFDSFILEKLALDDKRVSFIFDRVMKLKESLKSAGLDLAIFFGKPKDVFSYLNKFLPQEVVASGDYESYSLQRDMEISHILPFKQMNDTYIFSVNEILKKDSTPYLVFTPFYNQAKKIFNSSHLRKYEKGENSLFEFTYNDILDVNSETIKRLPLTLDSIGFKRVHYDLKPVETLLLELKEKMTDYKYNRDYLYKDATSNLSVHLRFGSLSIRELLRYLVSCKKDGVDTEPFFRQLIFRDFYAYLLFHFPMIETQNYKYRFNGIKDKEKYDIFCSAKTGVPIVDAGVKELLQTGNMHNRVRMVVASFFTKDLLLPWQWGEKFFAKHLLDYDKASNVLSWQWSAGTGVDPQPYFRVFNPYLQSKKFDKDGEYIKKFCTQLMDVDAKYLHDEEYLLKNSIKDYPRPIVIHKQAAKIAVEYFKDTNKVEEKI